MVQRSERGMAGSAVVIDGGWSGGESSCGPRFLQHSGVDMVEIDRTTGGGRERRGGRGGLIEEAYNMIDMIARRSHLRYAYLGWIYG